MSQSLFTLSAEYQRILDQIMENDEIDENLMQQCESIHDSIENKILNYTSIVKTLEAQIEGINKAMQGMKDRVCALNNKADRLRITIKEHMEVCKIEKAQNPYHVLKIVKNNPKVSDDIDENLLPSFYFKEKIERKIDRIALLKDLKEGIQVPGAYMVRETRLQIR